MAMLDDLFGGNAGANPLDQIRNGLLGDLLQRMASGQALQRGVSTPDIVAGMPAAGEAGVGRFAQPNLTPPTPMLRPEPPPVASHWQTSAQPAEPITTSAPAPQPARPDFSPTFGNRMVAFGKALQGQDPGDVDRMSQVKNETFDFLTRRGVSADDAKAIIGNPKLFEAALPALTGSKTKLEVSEIYDAEGRKQKVLLNPATGQYQPIGGALTPEGRGGLQVTEIYDSQGRPQKAVFDPRTGDHKPLGSAAAAKPDANVSIGQKAVDRDFAKDYVEFSTGGSADAQKNLDQLRLVKRELDDPNGPNLTGWFVGQMPDMVNSVFAPKAVDRRELVEEVVQRNLRLILGAQFTQREGDRLIARAFNPALDEETNSERLGRLIGAMEKAYEAKKAAAAYYEQHGTLAGFEGQIRFTSAELEAALDGPAGKKNGSAPKKDAAPAPAGPPDAAVKMLRSDPSPKARSQFDEIFGPGSANRILGAP